METAIIRYQYTFIVKRSEKNCSFYPYISLWWNMRWTKKIENCNFLNYSYIANHWYCMDSKINTEQHSRPLLSRDVHWGEDGGGMKSSIKPLEQINKNIEFCEKSFKCSKIPAYFLVSSHARFLKMAEAYAVKWRNDILEVEWCREREPCAVRRWEAGS